MDSSEEPVAKVTDAIGKFKSLLKKGTDSKSIRNRLRSRRLSSYHGKDRKSPESTEIETALDRFRRYGNFVRMALFWYKVHNFR